MVGLGLGLVCEGQELLSRCGDAGSGQAPGSSGQLTQNFWMYLVTA